MNPEQVAELAESLRLDEGDLVSDALLIAQVSNAHDGTSGVLIGATEQASWITQLGLLRAAELVVYRLNQEQLGED